MHARGARNNRAHLVLPDLAAASTLPHRRGKEVVMLYGSEIQLSPGKAYRQHSGRGGRGGFAFCRLQESGWQRRS